MYLIVKTKTGGILNYLDGEEDKNKRGPKKANPKLLGKFIQDGKSNAEIYEAYLRAHDIHEKAVITGGLAKEWGLVYSREEFIKLMNNRFTGTPDQYKEMYGKKLKKDGKVLKDLGDKTQKGYSMALSLNKSLSMLYAVAPPDIQKLIRECINRSDSELTKEMEKLLIPSCKLPSYQAIDPSKTKAVIIDFWHYESRTTDSTGNRIEPHLHKHKQLMNFAEFEINGQKKIMAIDGKKVLKHQKELTAKFNVLLVSELAKVGIKTEATVEANSEHSFRVVGISRDQELAMSSRTKEINAIVDELKQNGKFVSSTKEAEDEYKRQVSAKSRNEKDHDNAYDIHEQIKTETEKYIDYAKVQEEQSKPIEPKPEAGPDISKAVSTDSKFDLQGEMSETAIKTKIANEIKFSRIFNSLDELNTVIDSEFKGLIENETIVQKSTGAYTTPEAINNEYQTMKDMEAILKKDLDRVKAIDSKAVKDFAAAANAKGMKLNDGQIAACTTVSKQYAITYIEGDAGTGKTSSVIKFANDFYSRPETKRKVIGLATQNITAGNLADAGIKDRKSIAKFLAEGIDQKTGNWKSDFLATNRKAVLVVDEAGMVGAKDYRRLMDFALKTNSSLVLVGDVKQLASVTAGDMLNAISQELPRLNKARLSENMRQENPVARSIAEGFRDLKSKDAVNTLLQNNLLITKSGEDAREKLLADIAEDYFKDEAKTKMVIAYENKDCDDLNDSIRGKLIASGQLDIAAIEKQVQVGIVRKSGNGSTQQIERFFAVGDKIVFTNNVKVGKTKLENGQAAVIKAINPSKRKTLITVEIDGQDITFDAEKNRTFNHGYAVTSYKSQGQTVDNCYVYGSEGMDANTAYVDFSRHKKQVKLYIPGESLKGFIESTSTPTHKPTNWKDEKVSEYWKKKHSEQRQTEQKIDEEKSKKREREVNPNSLSKTTDEPENQRLYRLAKESGKIEEMQTQHNTEITPNNIVQYLAKEKKAKYDGRTKALKSSREKSEDWADSTEEKKDTLSKQATMKPALKPPSIGPSI